MLDILQGTPVWVYAVYLWICYYGIKACLGGRDNRRSLMILSAVLVVWSLISLAPSMLSSGAWVGGAVIGSLVTLTSVGAGAIGVIVLMLLYPALPLPRIVAADIAHAVPLTLVAGLGHASIGSVDWMLLAKLLAGSLPGIWLGSRLVSSTPDRWIRSLLSVLLAYAGVKLIAL